MRLTRRVFATALALALNAALAQTRATGYCQGHLKLGGAIDGIRPACRLQDAHLEREPRRSHYLNFPTIDR